MVTLASPIIRAVATTTTVTDREITNPTASSVGAQVVILDDPGGLSVNTTDNAFQVLSDGTVAFKTDLAATTTKQINVLDVLTNQYPVASEVTASETSSIFTMENEYYTVRLRKTQSYVYAEVQTPVESITPKSGTIVFTGGDHLPEWANYFYDYFNPVITNYEFEVLEQGPLLTRVKMTYTFSHDAYMVGAIQVFPANSSAIVSETVELRAGVNAVFFETYSEYNWVSGLNIENLDVDQIRYRGNYSNSLARGYTNIDGGGTQTYRFCCSPTATPYLTAIKDLTAPLEFNDYNGNPLTPLWNPFISDTGRFVIARDSSGTGHYVGISGGSAATALGTVYTGVKYTGSGTATKIIFASNGRAPNGTLMNPFRYSWALCVGDEPLLDDETLPEPGVIQNQHTFLTLTKLVNWVQSSPSETFSSQSLYMSSEQYDDLITRIQASPAYADILIGKDSTSQALIEYIEDPTLVRAEALYDDIIELRQNMKDAFWFKNGYFEHLYHYWMGALEMLRLLPRIPFLMRDTNLTAEQKSEIYKSMLFFGFVMADGDFVPPLENIAQFSTGGTNNLVQYSTQKDSLHITLLENPKIAEHFDVAAFADRTIVWINIYISPYGSSAGSPKYTAAGTESILNVCQQSYAAGIADVVSETPRIELFANFMLSTLTPEDSRFTDPYLSQPNLRKMIAVGDGSLEGSTLHGQLGTMFADINPTLSAKLMDAWASMGSPHGGFYQSSAFKIDDTLPTASMALTDAHYPDYWSVFRSGFDTANESAIWFMHGDWLSDHRCYDAGAVYCYLLGKPIALSWSSVYSPYIPTSLLHNGLTRVADLTWDGTGGEFSLFSGTGSGSDVFATDSVTYTSSSTRPTTSSTFDLDTSTIWTREVMLNKEEVARPVLVITDTFAGTNAADEKVLNLNLMMTGAVVTPTGNVTPSTVANKASSTNKAALSSGWSTFEFTGQWGVNVILMVHNASAADYQLGRLSHTYSPDIEKAQYLLAVGSSYVEMQYQFRLWSTDDSIFVLVPWLASGSKPTVTTSGMDVLVDGDVVT